MSNEHEQGNDPGNEPKPGPFTQQVQHTSVAARVPEGVGRGVVCTAVMVFHTNHEFVIDFLATMVPPPQVVARVVLSPITFSKLIRVLQANMEKYKQQFGGLSAREPARRERGPGQHEPTQSGPPASDAPAREPDDAQTAGAVAGQPIGAAGGPDSAGSTEDRPPMEPGRPVEQQPQRIEDIYEQLKLPDEMLGGVFANVAMIRHTGEEFCFDFIANFYPRSVVTKRVYMSAGRIPSLLATMTDSFEQFRRKTGGAGPA